MTAPEQAGHELLLRLAGRLPDELLWRLRDWLASDGSAGSAAPAGRRALAAALPRELLRHRTGLDESECELLAAAIGGWGAPQRMLDAVLPVGVADEVTPDFRQGPVPIDAAALALLAVVRGHPGCRELLIARRADQRVILVRGGDRPWALTGTLQRLLRAHGDRMPCVEVLPAEDAPTAYHRAALSGATRLWTAPSMVPTALVPTALIPTALIPTGA